MFWAGKRLVDYLQLSYSFKREKHRETESVQPALSVGYSPYYMRKSVGTGSDSGRTNATKTVSDVFRHQSGTGKSYCRMRFDVGSERVNSQGYMGKHITGALRYISFLQQCCWRFKCSRIWCYYHWASCSHYMITAPSYLQSNNPKFLSGFYIISQETWIFRVLYVLFRQYTYTKLYPNSSC
jgi:hypothetical protein